MKKILSFYLATFLLSISFSAIAQIVRHPLGLFTLTQPTATTMDVRVILGDVPNNVNLKLVHAPNGLLGNVPSGNMSKVIVPNFITYSGSGITLNSNVNYGFFKIRHAVVEDSLWFNIHYAVFYNPAPGAKLEHRDQNITFTSGATESFTHVILSKMDFPVYHSAGLPLGWQPVSDLINVAARKSSGVVNTFAQAATLNIRYTDGFFTEYEENNMALFRWDQTTNDWVREKCIQPDTLNNIVNTTINRSGTYVLCVLANNLNLAPIFTAGNRSYAAADKIVFFGTIDSIAKVKLITGKEILFESGFSARGNTELTLVTTNGYCGAVVPASAMGEITAVYYGLTEDQNLFMEEEDFTDYNNHFRSLIPSPPKEEDKLAKITEQPVQVIPNPFSDEIRVIYNLPERQSLNIKLYEANGREVLQLYSNDSEDAGQYAYNFRTNTLKQGLYFLVIQTAKQAPQVVKIVKQ